MAHVRYHFKICNLPLFPTLGVVLGSLLAILLLLSVFIHNFLEVQRPFEIPDQPFYLPEETNVSSKPIYFSPVINVNAKPKSTPKQPTPVSKQPWESTSIEDVPTGRDPRLSEVWNSSLAEWYQVCTEPSKFYPVVTSKSGNKGYLVIEANGELSMQRAGIADSVVIARILDVTMVLPSLALEDSDSSQFEDIFDIEHFISVLAEDVPIVRTLPTDENLLKDVLIFSAPRKAVPIFYEVKLVPELQKKPVIRFTKTDNRLSDVLDPDLQKLRCRVNYNALHFVHPLAELGQKLIQRMKLYSKTGRYVAVNIRFDQELLSSSGCYFGGGEKELKDLRIYRRRWNTNYHQKDPHKERREGRCPLTPMELGLFLRAMGFGNDTFLYIVMGQIYGGEETLSPLKKLFPNHYTRDTLAKEEELSPFRSSRSKLAAIDYIVCKESNVFVANDNSDMPKMMAGHRRFDGHQRTIRPNFQKLSLLYIARHNLGWNQFASKTRIFQQGFTGEPKEKTGREFYENPDACICAKGRLAPIKTAHHKREIIKSIHKGKTGGYIDEPDWIEVEEEKENEDTIAEEMDSSINETMKSDEDEEDDVPEDWPWMMN